MMSFLSFQTPLPGFGPFRYSDSEHFSLVCWMYKFQTVIEQKYAKYCIPWQVMQRTIRVHRKGLKTSSHNDIRDKLDLFFFCPLKHSSTWGVLHVSGVTSRGIFSKSSGCKRKGVPYFGGKLFNWVFFRCLEHGVA